MRNEGWTLNDLAGELWARGVDISDVPQETLEIVLESRDPSAAADFITS